MTITIIIALLLCIIEFLVIVIASPMANPALVLRNAGFSKIKSNHHKSKPWITVLAKK